MLCTPKRSDSKHPEISGMNMAPRRSFFLDRFVHRDGGSALAITNLSASSELRQTVSNFPWASAASEPGSGGGSRTWVCLSEGRMTWHLIVFYSIAPRGQKAMANFL